MQLKKNLDTAIYELLMNSFFYEEYEPGQRLDPTELAEKYKISKTPVIQALKRLANENVIDVNSTGKYSIIVPNKTILRELCELRYMYESYAVSRLLQDIKNENITLLEQKALKCKELMSSDDMSLVLVADYEFHRCLISMTHNVCIGESYETVLKRYIAAKYVAGYKNEAQLKAINAHFEMIKCLQNGDRDKLMEILHDHIDFLSEGLFSYKI
jgi:DNA-binding GntR family transcriptional regulator